jgi:hypothetical protein
MCCPATDFAHRLRGARLPAFRQAPRGVKHPQDFYRVAAHPVRDEVPGLGDDQLSRAGYTPRAAESLLLRQLRNRLEDALDHQTRGNRIVRGNKGGFFIEVA